MDERKESPPQYISFATDLYREAEKIRPVQKALGYADLSTTMIYVYRG